MIDAGLLTLIIGYAATIVGTSIMLPQVVRTLRTKRVDDLSFAMLIFYFANCALWLAYGLLISSLPLILTNFIALIISIVQIGLKMKYSK